MRYVFFLLTQNYSADEVKTFCLIRFSGLQVLGKEDTGYRVTYDNNPHTITAVQIAEQLPRLGESESPWQQTNQALSHSYLATE